ncbi:hypothetical protein EDD37DRAFT_379434 [Exophiala viscosa]|uniref:uncharacterized protein n=1 Tax=Exophiala viscosa TaxID=2486360 RepID=UPI002190AEFB|nr:hypothetical protein EDD37DRAFT_379434 [Exophiala viscosa]
MRYDSLLALGVLTASMLSVMSSSTKKTCYSMNGEVLDSVYQPCNPDAEFSACCELNGTSGQNDMCMDSGLCMSTSGWYSTFLYSNGCTDPTGKAKACPQACSFMPTGYSYNVLQCNANNGSFCCRAGGDETNCCNDTASSFQADVTIGQILLPGTSETVNTTYSTIIQTPSKDKTAVVGGVLGAVLGAALIASLLALWYLMRSRKSLKYSYISLQNERDTALQQGASEKAALQHQIEQQQLQYQQYQQQHFQCSLTRQKSLRSRDRSRWMQ